MYNTLRRTLNKATVLDTDMFSPKDTLSKKDRMFSLKTSTHTHTHTQAQWQYEMKGAAPCEPQGQSNKERKSQC